MEKISFLVDSIEVMINHFVLELIPTQCMKREGQDDIFVFRESDGAVEGHQSVK